MQIWFSAINILVLPSSSACCPWDNINKLVLNYSWSPTPELRKGKSFKINELTLNPTISILLVGSKKMNIPEIPERPNRFTSISYILLGLFFIIYPISGTINNNFIFIPRVGKIGVHLHGKDAIIIAIGVIFIGISLLISGIWKLYFHTIYETYNRKNEKIYSKAVNYMKYLGWGFMIFGSVYSCF